MVLTFFSHLYDGYAACTFFLQPGVVFLQQNSILYQDIGSVVSSFLIGLLITTLSCVLIATTTTTSWMLAAVMTVNNGIPFLSFSTCLLVPSLPLSAGLQPELSSLMVL
jgi:hypothetical protein